MRNPFSSKQPVHQLYLDGACAAGAAECFVALWKTTASLLPGLLAVVLAVFAVYWVGSALKKSLGF